MERERPCRSESLGELQAAIGAYEESGNAATEVPRLLFERGLLSDLEQAGTSASPLTPTTLIKAESRLNSTMFQASRSQWLHRIHIASVPTVKPSSLHIG